MAGEGLALRRKASAQLGEVVDFAVENDDIAAVRTLHRLMPQVRKVDDGQPVEAERGPVVAPYAAVIGAAMALPFDGRGQVGTESRARAGGET